MTRRGIVLELLGPSPRGVTRHVEAIREWGTKRQWDVRVAAPAHSSIDADVLAPLDESWSPVSVARATRFVARLVVGYDLVHAHSLKAAWATTFAPWCSVSGSRPPVVLSLHTPTGASDDDTGAARLLWRQVLRRVDHVIATSQDLAAAAAEVVGVDATTLIEPFGPEPLVTRDAGAVRAELGVGNSPLVLCVSRLERVKRIDVLIEAIARVVTSVPNAQLVVVGSGSMARALDDLVRTRGLEKCVRFLGDQERVDDLVAAADVIVNASAWEAGPLVLREAAVLARAIVTTPVGFACTIIDDGVSGRIVEPGDVEGLAGAIAGLLLQPDEARRLGRSAQERAAALDPGVLSARLDDVYERVVNRWRTPT